MTPPTAPMGDGAAPRAARNAAAWLVALTAGAAGLAACNSTEVGNPPFSPDMPDAGVSADNVHVSSDPDNPDRIENAITDWEIDGASLPADTRSVRITPLDTTDPATELLPDADGVFAGKVTVAVEDEVRVQLVLEEGRRSPADFVVTRERELAPADRPFQDCLQWERLEAVFRAAERRTATRLRNDCEGPLQLGDVTWRVEPPDTRLLRAPEQIAPGEIGVVEFERPEGASASESIAFVPVLAPMRSRFPITVRAE